MKTATDSRLLLWLAMGGFLIQLLASYFQPRPGYYMVTDSPVYWANAISIFNEFKVQDTFYPMGTSLFLSPLYAVGLSPFSVVLFVHPVLHVVNVLLAYRIVRRYGSNFAALIAASLVMVYPPLLNYSRQLLSESWFVTTLFGAFALLTDSGKTKMFLGGLLLGLSVLVRTPALGIVGVFFFALFLLRYPLLHILSCALGVGLVLVFGLWMATRSSGHFTVLVTGTSMATTRRSVPGGYEDIPVDQQKSSYLAMLRSDPVDFGKQRLCSLTGMLSPWPLGSSRSLATKLIIFCSDAPVLIATLLAAGIACRKKIRSPVWLLICPALGLVGFYSLFFVESRYRMPYLPFLICFSVIVLASQIPKNIRQHGD